MFGFGSLNSMTARKTNDENEVLTKLGVKILKTVDDETYSYKSALI